MEKQCEKLISNLLIILIQSPLMFVQAMGFRLAAMKREITRDVSTMAVDGITLFVNPDWTLAQTKPKLLFVLLHEACHVWMLHPMRMAQALSSHLKDAVHQAADYVVNLTLQQANSPYPVPDDALLDRSFVDGHGRCLNLERVLDLMKQEQEQEQEQGQDNADDNQSGSNSTEADTEGGAAADSDSNSAESGPEQSGTGNQSPDSDGDGGDGLPGSSHNIGGNNLTPDSCGELLPAPPELDEAEHVQRNEQALQLAAKGAGSMPSNMLEELHRQATACDTSWLDLFRDRFNSAVNTNDWSYERFNQQYAMIGLIEPSLYQDTVGTVAIVVDESSSMDNDQLNKATKQAAAIVDEWQPENVLIIRHTTKIVDIQELHAGQQPEPREKRGHGGTFFNPVIDFLDDKYVDVCCWVTDCQPCDTVKDTPFPVIWLGTGYDADYWHKAENLQGDFVSID